MANSGPTPPKTPANAVLKRKNPTATQLPQSPPPTHQRQLAKKHVVSKAPRDRNIRNPRAQREQQLRTLQIAAQQRDITGPALTFEDLNARYLALEAGQLTAANRQGPYSSHFYELVGRGGPQPNPVIRRRMYMHADVRDCANLESLLKSLRLEIGKIYRSMKEPRSPTSAPEVESSVHERGLALQQPHLDVVLTAYGRDLIYLYSKFVSPVEGPPTAFVVSTGHLDFTQRMAAQRTSFQSVHKLFGKLQVGLRGRVKV